MTKYIDKSAVVAEIKGYISNYKEIVAKINRNDSTWVDSVSMIESKIGVLQHLLSFLDTLEVKEVEEETISEDLEYAALLHYPKMSRISEPHGFIPADNKSHYLGDANEDNRKAFIVGAQWQKEQDAIEVKEVDLNRESAWKPADGDELPEIDREVIVLTQSYPLEGNEYAVSFAHRPNPNGWDGKSVTTGEIEHYIPKTYGKSGWNQPNVKWWLNLELPKME